MKTKNPMEMYIEEWKRSGKTIKSYCLEKGIPKDKFDYLRFRKWKGKTGEEKRTRDKNPKISFEGTKNRFIPIELKEDRSIVLEIEIDPDGRIHLKIGGRE